VLSLYATPKKKRERKDHRQQHRARGAVRRQIEPGEVVQRDHCQDERQPRDRDPRDVEGGVLPAEGTRDRADEQRIYGKVGDVAAAVRERRVAAPRDALEVAAVPAGEGVPERARRSEDRELLALVERKRHVHEQREQGGKQPESQRPERDAQRRASAG
jgi:hypothetical protein